MRRTVTSMALKEQAKLLAEGYLQGQRDLLISILEHRFDDPLPSDVVSHVAAMPPDMIPSLGPIVSTAPDLAAFVEATDLLVAEA